MFGTLPGNSNAPGFTYNVAGFAAGLDYRFNNNVLAGVTAGYSSATLYTQTQPGQGTSNGAQFGVYGEFTQGPVYVDGLAGYARADNRMTRQIIFPGLFRTASGQTNADQFFGLVEAGYKISVAPSFDGFITPFARLQGSTSTQAGFTETGADSLNLTIAQQTTNSLRTVFGAQLGATVMNTDLVFRLGWRHEFADLSRPVTSAFAGAPALSITIQGTQGQRDGVVLGLRTDTRVADSTSLYLRYDGDLSGDTASHTISGGVRIVW